jgi:serine/alanine adding enzyme
MRSSALRTDCDTKADSGAAADRAALDAQSRVSIVSIGDSEACQWDAFVAGASGASIYHRYLWRDVIRSLFGHETHYLAARGDSGEIFGVLPLVRLKSRLFGDFLVSLPYFNYGGVLAQDDRIQSALLEGASELALGLGTNHVELRQRQSLPGNWPSRLDKVSMLLPLPGDPVQLWRSLPSKLRSQAKRPLREGAACEFGGEELLRDFYVVFSRNMRDLGTPIHAVRFFQTILRALPECTRIALVRLRRQPVAAAFLIEHAGTMEIPWASSLRPLNGLGINMQLYWNVLERAVFRGCHTFDFGRSTVEGGTFNFKKQWGALPVQLHWHYWLRHGGALPKLRPDNPKYRTAIAAWRRLPLPVANLIGPPLARNLP